MAKMSKGGITAKRKAQKSSPALDAQNAKMTQKGSKKFNKGGKVNTSRMNRLEELGRVNAEKANTSRGKRNLSAEKRRIIRGLKK